MVRVVSYDDRVSFEDVGGFGSSSESEVVEREIVRRPGVVDTKTGVSTYRVRLGVCDQLRGEVSELDSFMMNLDLNFGRVGRQDLTWRSEN